MHPARLHANRSQNISRKHFRWFIFRNLTNSQNTKIDELLTKSITEKKNQFPNKMCSNNQDLTLKTSFQKKCEFIQIQTTTKRLSPNNLAALLSQAKPIHLY